MSEDTRSRLREIQARRKALEDRKQESLNLGAGRDVHEELAVVIEIEENILLEILSEHSIETNKILDQVKQATERLTESSKEQAALTAQLERSSQRLDVLTQALLLLTAILAVTGIGSYALSIADENGLVGLRATWITSVIVTIVVVAIFLSFWYVTKRSPGRSKKAREEKA